MASFDPLASPPPPNNALPLDWAQHWARCGLAVFPCRTNAKPPNIGEWFAHASRDPSVIADWWRRWPHANIGAVPGRSACLVIDLDVKHSRNGPAELARLQAEHGSLPDTFTVKTPSGGLHLWFGGNVGTSSNRIAPGIDVRSNNADGSGAGLIIMPRSTIADRPYTIERLAPVAPCPAWLHELAEGPTASRDPMDMGLRGGEVPKPPYPFVQQPREALASWFMTRPRDRSRALMSIWRQFWGRGYSAEQAIEAARQFADSDVMGHYHDHPLGFDHAMTRDVRRSYIKFAERRAA